MSFPKDDILEDVVENKSKVLDLLNKNNNYSASDMAEKLELTQRTIQRYLKLLQNEKKIERTGPAKGGYWKILRN